MKEYQRFVCNAVFARANLGGCHGSGYNNNHHDMLMVAIPGNTCSGRLVDVLCKNSGCTEDKTGSLNIGIACSRKFFFFGVVATTNCFPSLIVSDLVSRRPGEILFCIAKMLADGFPRRTEVHFGNYFNIISV
jgi:hypothetical protein